ncbi:hypothetical protein CEW46_30605 [Bacillus cereus]|nr:hypothetical protein CEW46_30605 [Bacillus cereus]
MFECYGCNTEYEDEKVATKCCTTSTPYPDGDIRLPRKLGRPWMKGHFCPNVTHGGQSWSIMLKVDEKCPMCEYTYKPR